MNLRFIVFSLVPAVALTLLLKKSFREQAYKWLNKINVQRHLLIVLVAILVALIYLIYPHLNKQITDFRKNI